MRLCTRGHELSDENAMVQLDGRGYPFLMCRTCNRERAKLWRKKNKHRLVRVPGPSGGRQGQTLRHE